MDVLAESCLSNMTDLFTFLYTPVFCSLRLGVLVVSAPLALIRAEDLCLDVLAESCLSDIFVLPGLGSRGVVGLVCPTLLLSGNRSIDSPIPIMGVCGEPHVA